MGSKLHGIFSLILVLAAVVMALIYMLGVSLGWGLVYLGIIAVANPLVLYSYCAKCLCRDHACSHVFPGKLTSLLPARKQGPYSFMDYLGTALPLIALLGFPQFWLWQRKAVFFAYWILILLGLIEVFFLVCRACRNENCPMNGSA